MEDAERIFRLWGISYFEKCFNFMANLPISYIGRQFPKIDMITDCLCAFQIDPYM